MKGLHIVSDFDELRLLSNRLAYRILQKLQKKPASGAEIAEALGMKTPRVIYYLKKLEEFGLAVQVDRKPQRGNREIFYRATARELVISAGIEGNAEEKAQIRDDISSSYLDYFLKNVIELDIDDFIRMIVHDYLCIKPGEKVAVVFGEENTRLLSRLIIELRHSGAKCRTFFSSIDLTQDLWSSLDLENVRTFYSQRQEEMEWADVWLVLKRSETPDISGIPEERIKRISAFRGEISSYLLSKPGLRFLAISSPPFEREFFTDQNVIDRLDAYWKAVSVGRDAFREISDIGHYIIGTGSFVIETGLHKKLEVEFSRDNYFLDAGPFTNSPYHRNSLLLPSGEVALLPIPGRVNGEILCEFCDPRVGDVSGVHLVIENSIVKDVKAEKGLDELQTILDVLGNASRTVAQVGFGMNPSIKDIELLPELANRLYGSFHLSFGNNEMLGGSIKEPRTWNMVSLSPRVTANGRTILDENVFDIEIPYHGGKNDA